MGKSTIEWTDYTFNPWIGCQRVSPGCEHCYAEALVRRAPALVLGHGYHVGTPGRLPIWGPLAPRRITSDAYWEQPKRWNRLAEKAGGRKRVFCASMADVFESRSELDAVRARLWDLIEQTPSLVWMLLTKRPQNIQMRGSVGKRSYTSRAYLSDGTCVTVRGIHLPDGGVIRVDPRAIRARAAQDWRTQYAPLPQPPLRGSGGVEAPTIATSHWASRR